VAEGQCVIVTSDSFAFVDGQLWLHNIYLRHHRAASASVGAALPQTVSKRALSTQLAGGPPTLIHASAEATALYMTDVCLQGNGVLDIVGLSAGSPTYIKGNLLEVALDLWCGSLSYCQQIS
jgi:hypothetical protein